MFWIDSEIGRLEERMNEMTMGYTPKGKGATLPVSTDDVADMMEAQTICLTKLLRRIILRNQTCDEYFL